MLTRTRTGRARPATKISTPDYTVTVTPTVLHLANVIGLSIALPSRLNGNRTGKAE